VNGTWPILVDNELTYMNSHKAVSTTTTLEERRNRTDLIEVFKIMRGYSSIPVDLFFEVNKDGRTRGHTLKLVKHRSDKDLRHHFFSERVVNRWNQLHGQRCC